MTEKNSKDARTLYLRGEEFFKNGNFCEAHNLFKDVLKLDPKDDLKIKAQNMIQKISFDKVELIFGIASLCLLTALYTYFAFIR